MRKLFLSISFFIITPIFLLVNIGLLSYITFQKNQNKIEALFGKQQPTVSYAALPTNVTAISGEVNSVDARIEKLREFFASYNSVLANYSEIFVASADKNNLDYRLLAAISMQESQGCKKIPNNSFNCFGYGVTKHKTLTFDSYPQAIETVSSAMGKYYINQGLNTPDKIGQRWNPTNNNEWIDKVNYFINEI